MTRFNTLQMETKFLVSSDANFVLNRFPSYTIGANNTIIEKNHDPAAPSLKEIVAMETIQLLQQQKRLSVRDLAKKFEKGLATAAKLSNEVRWKENASLERHVLLKKLRDLLEALKGRVAGRNKDDVEEAISMVEALAFQLTQAEADLIQEKSEVKRLASFLKQATEDSKKVVEEERAFAIAEIESARQAVCRVELAFKEQEKTLRASENQVYASNNPELLKKLVATFQVGDDFDCPICLCPPAKTVITSCAHVFCQICIMRTFKQTASRCPICRRPLSKENLFLAPPSQSTSDEDILATSSDKSISSKISTLLKLLLAVQEHSPSTKSIIFSQFRKMLLLLEDPLRAAGFSIIRLDGSMTTKKRTEVIKEFSSTSPNSPTILLASLKAAGTGINLTAASRVYLMEPWWNPAVEEQAMDRVHRIGQRKEVKVVRLIVRGTIEEKILELQERKKKLASGAFGRRSSKEEDKHTRVEDLRTIMRL